MLLCTVHFQSLKHYQSITLSSQIPSHRREKSQNSFTNLQAKCFFQILVISDLNRYKEDKLLGLSNLLKHSQGLHYSYYTPGIYADGYIVFAFPFVRSSVRMFVCSFVRSLVRSLFRNVRGIYVKVFVKVSLLVYIS